jgi:hypothetical protein
MKKTFFNLVKRASQVKAHSNHLKPTSSDLVTTFLPNLSEETRDDISNEIRDTLYKFSFREIQNNIQKGTELIANRSKRDPLASLDLFKKSTKIADSLLENYSIESLSNQNRLILAQAYAGYANGLRKCQPEEIEVREKMVDKALKLDPENKVANELNLDMHFYDTILESPVNKS